MRAASPDTMTVRSRSRRKPGDHGQIRFQYCGRRKLCRGVAGFNDVNGSLDVHYTLIGGRIYAMATVPEADSD